MRQRQIIDQRRIPLWPTKGVAQTNRYVLQIVDGNTVFSSGATTYYGVKRAGSAISTVASLYDPNGVGATPGLFSAADGIGRAKLWLNGVLQSGFVLVVLDSNSPIPTLCVNGDTVRSEAIDALTLVADPTQSVQAYRLTFV